MPKQKKNWIVDAILFIGFLMTFFLDWTGLSWHQWLGVLLGVLACYHLLVHWKWVVAVTKRLMGSTSRQSRIYYLLDWIILLSFLLIGLSGLWISTWLDLALANYLFWKDLHVYSSIASLAIILIKIAVHWRWIVNTARNYFGLWKPPTPAGPTVAVSSRVQSGSMNRREFLQLMGLAGLASLLSATNVVDLGQAAGQSILENQSAQPQAPDPNEEIWNGSESSCQVICDQGCTFPGQCRRYIDQNGNGVCDLTECINQNSITLETEKSSTSQEDLQSALPQMESATTTGEQNIEECVVLCQKNCAYPGECSDYIDLNGNRLCDYGECLANNTEQTILFSSHSGGGGRKRRGQQ